MGALRNLEEIRTRSERISWWSWKVLGQENHSRIPQNGFSTNSALAPRIWWHRPCVFWCLSFFTWTTNSSCRHFGTSPCMQPNDSVYCNSGSLGDSEDNTVPFRISELSPCSLMTPCIIIQGRYSLTVRILCHFVQFGLGWTKFWHQVNMITSYQQLSRYSLMTQRFGHYITPFTI